MVGILGFSHQWAPIIHGHELQRAGHAAQGSQAGPQEEEGCHGGGTRKGMKLEYHQP